jgi:molecular chaperone DnaK (HSP70)
MQALLPLTVALGAAAGGGELRSVRYAVGLDCGTELSKVAVEVSLGRGVSHRDRGAATPPDYIVVNAAGKRKSVSALAFQDDGELLLGDAATGWLSAHPTAGVSHIKQLLGTERSSAAAWFAAHGLTTKLSHVGNFRRARTVVVLPHSPVPGNASIGAAVQPEALAALLLRQLQQDVTKTLASGGTASLPEAQYDVAECSLVVGTVPECFGALQRAAVRDSFSLAGMRQPVLLSEHAALAFKYAVDHMGRVGVQTGSQTDAETVVLFLDAGAGAATASVTRFRKVRLEDDHVLRSRGLTTTQEVKQADVLATASDTEVGGRAFDAAIAKLLLAQYNSRCAAEQGGGSVGAERGGSSSSRSSSQFDVREDLRAVGRFHKEAQRMKHVLSANAQAQVKMEGLPQPGGGVEGVLQLSLPRTQYEDLVMPLVQQVVATAHAARAEAEAGGVGRRQQQQLSIDKIVLVGGASHTPLLHQQLQSEFPAARLEPFSLNADEAVAHGAALFAKQALDMDGIISTLNGSNDATEVAGVAEPELQWVWLRQRKKDKAVGDTAGDDFIDLTLETITADHQAVSGSLRSRAGAMEAAADWVTAVTAHNTRRHERASAIYAMEMAVNQFESQGFLGDSTDAAAGAEAVAFVADTKRWLSDNGAGAPTEVANGVVSAPASAELELAAVQARLQRMRGLLAPAPGQVAAQARRLLGGAMAAPDSVVVHWDAESVQSAGELGVPLGSAGGGLREGDMVVVKGRLPRLAAAGGQGTGVGSSTLFVVELFGLSEAVGEEQVALRLDAPGGAVVLRRSARPVVPGGWSTVQEAEDKPRCAWSEVRGSMVRQQRTVAASAPTPPEDDEEEEAASWESQVRAIYEAHDADKVAKVPSLMAKYAGLESKLLAALRAKYGIEPPPPPPPRVEEDVHVLRRLTATQMEEQMPEGEGTKIKASHCRTLCLREPACKSFDFGVMPLSAEEKASEADRIQSQLEAELVANATSEAGATEDTDTDTDTDTEDTTDNLGGTAAGDEDSAAEAAINATKAKKKAAFEAKSVALRRLKAAAAAARERVCVLNDCRAPEVGCETDSSAQTMRHYACRDLPQRTAT